MYPHSLYRLNVLFYIWPQCSMGEISEEICKLQFPRKLVCKVQMNYKSNYEDTYLIFLS